MYWILQLERWNCGFESHLYVAYILSAFFRAKEFCQMSKSKALPLRHAGAKKERTYGSLNSWPRHEMVVSG
jgi:hypothetical protein